MASIRDDLEGVVLVQTRDGLGEPITLRAGDKVPRGVTVGDHLIAQSTGRTRGQRPQPDGPFDPNEHTAEEVIDYLASAGTSDEVTRVVEAEKAGKNRKTVIESVEGAPEDPGNDPEQPPAGPDENPSPEDGEKKPAGGEPVERPPASGPGSDKGAWRRYAESLGIEVDSEMSRADIQAAVEAHEQP